ncbi:hypothetical protein A4A49_27186 [Nicotiana attenuata]|uniref:Uncharacterized protein n=1 Tax=Nicotiana attenuata TaxID=49451 RepID=A0A314L4C1_NICAT|nr:hypothetical protein A4A49_27186 [Nicotiana attenuata]
MDGISQVVNASLETTSTVNGTRVNVIVATGDKAGIKDAKLPTNLVKNQATAGIQVARLNAPADRAASRFGATDCATKGVNIKGDTGFHDKGDDCEVLQISRSSCEATGNAGGLKNVAKVWSVVSSSKRAATDHKKQACPLLVLCASAQAGPETTAAKNKNIDAGMPTS